MSTPQESYTAIVTTLRELGPALGAAIAVQFEAPPRARAIKEPVSESKGIPNPTVDTVLDPRRLALSEEIKATEADLRRAVGLLTPHVPALRRAVARWEGHEGD